MSTEIEIVGLRATVANGVWSSPNAQLQMWLREVSHPPHDIPASDPDPDTTVARQFIKRFRGKIVSVAPQSPPDPTRFTE